MNIAAGGLIGSNAFGVDYEAMHALGTRSCFAVKDSEGYEAFTEAVYIKAEAALTLGFLCELPLVRGTDAYEVDTPLTTTLAANFADAQNERFAVCVPLATLASGQYGWAAVKGLVPTYLGANCAKNKLLYTTATAGLVDDADTDYEVVGLHPVSDVGGSNAVTDCAAFHDIFIRRDAA